MHVGKGEGESCGKRAGAQRGRGFKSSEYVRILTVYFPFVKIFSIKKKNGHVKGNEGFSNFTSE